MEKYSRKYSIRWRNDTLSVSCFSNKCSSKLKKIVEFDSNVWLKSHLFKVVQICLLKYYNGFFSVSISYIYFMFMTISHLERNHHFDIFLLKCLYFVHLFLVNVLNNLSL